MTIREITEASKWRIVSSSIIPDPKHAVKELIDNALDARASSIYVDIDATTSGCHYICVRDDGSGVDKTDRNTICSNHATSKISSLSDLSHLESLGFRGQALFSLATLANKRGSMEITTKTKDESVGERWLVPKEGSNKATERKKVSCPTGTTILIRNLLLGLRARYLHTVARAAKCNEETYRLIQHYSLIFRSTRFHFSLVTIDKSGLVTRKQLQESLEPNISRVRALSIASKIRSPTADNFLVNENLVVSKFIQLSLILPIMRPQTDVYGLKKNRRFLSVNGRAISLGLTFGSSFARVISKVYRNAGFADPTTWYVDVTCDSRILDVNVEPGKDDVMVKDMTALMTQLEDLLSAYLTAELGKEELQEIEMTEQSPRIPDTATTTSTSGESRTNVTRTEESPRHGHRNMQEVAQNVCDLTNHRKSIITSPPKESTSSTSTPPDFRYAKRKATSELTSSQNSRWKCNLNSEDVVNTQELSNDGSSSKEISPMTTSRNEDVELGRNISLSNPFMTAKLKHFNVKQRKIEVPQQVPEKSNSAALVDLTSHQGRKKSSVPTNDHEECTPFESSTSVDPTQREPSQVSESFEQRSSSSICDDTTLVDELGTGDKALGRKPFSNLGKVRSFSEHTEGLTQLIDYKYGQLKQNVYKDELQWLSRNPDPIARITDSLAGYSEDLRDKNISLAQGKDGWLVMTI